MSRDPIDDIARLAELSSDEARELSEALTDSTRRQRCQEDLATHERLSRLLAPARQQFPDRVRAAIRACANGRAMGDSPSSARMVASSDRHRASRRSRTALPSARRQFHQAVALAALMGLLLGGITLGSMRWWPHAAHAYWTGTTEGWQIAGHWGSRTPSEGMELQVDDLVSATDPDHAGNRADRGCLRLKDGSRIMLETQARVRWIAHDGDACLGLDQGAIHVEAAHQRAGHPLMIITPILDVRVVGTTFAVGVATDASQVSVTRGQVSCLRRSDGATFLVSAYQVARVRERGAVLCEANDAVVTPHHWYVAAGSLSLGTGSMVQPFATLSEVVPHLHAGDVVQIGDGTYHEAISVTGLERGQPIIITAEHSGQVHLIAPGPVLDCSGNGLRIEGLVAEATTATASVVRIAHQSASIELHHIECRGGSQGVVIDHAREVTLEDLVIGHLAQHTGIPPSGVQIVAAQDVQCNRCTVTMESGDAIRVEGDGSDRISLNACLLIGSGGAIVDDSAPLVRVENGINCKIGGKDPRGHLIVSGCRIRGFSDGAGLHLRENTLATISDCVISGCRHGVRIRGSEIDPVSSLRTPSAEAVIRRCVLHHDGTALRYEDGVVMLRVVHVTFGAALDRLLDMAGEPSPVPTFINNLVLGTLPPPMDPASNRACTDAAFVAAGHDDYRLDTTAGAALLVPSVPDSTPTVPPPHAASVGAYPVAGSGPPDGP